jgi:hypothetical protein
MRAATSKTVIIIMALVVAISSGNTTGLEK